MTLQILKIATIWYSIYRIHIVTKKYHYLTISVVVAITVNYILRNLKIGYFVFSLHNKSYFMLFEKAKSLTAYFTPSIQ